MKTLEENAEREYALNELKMKNEYYMQKMDAEERIKEVYHDLKNYFLLSDHEKVSEELRKKLTLYEQFYKTGNDFLDIILAEKIRKAYEVGIQMECHVDFSKGGFIAPLDVSTIFGNLLDNALEATQKIEEEEKYIWISVSVKRQLLVLVIKNNMSGSCNGILVTDKWNSSYHGYGLKNVRKSVKAYDGEMKIDVGGKEFKVSIVIPIPQN